MFADGSRHLCRCPIDAGAADISARMGFHMQLLHDMSSQTQILKQSDEIGCIPTAMHGLYWSGAVVKPSVSIKAKVVAWASRSGFIETWAEASSLSALD